MSGRPGRLARWRFAVFWRALGERGREHVVRHLLEQVAEGEAERRHRGLEADPQEPDAPAADNHATTAKEASDA